MANEKMNPLNIIEEANTKTLNYFNKVYIDNLELVQSLKTERIELDVKIDTLEKTKDLYSCHVENRRNVFSPISEDDHNAAITRSLQIEKEIQDLKDSKQNLENRIFELEQKIPFYKEQVDLLSKADKCIHTVFMGRHHEDDNIEDDDAIEFIESEEEESKSYHAYNLLLLEDYEHHQIASELDQNVKQEILADLNKIEDLKWLLHSDVVRAKLTLEELSNSSESILTAINALLYDLNYNIDIKQPIKNQVYELMERYKISHPECKIDASCECTEDSVSLPSVITFRLVNMLDEVLDNVFKHSNADQLKVKVFISSRLVDVSVNDNGIGIPEDYLERSDWSSGLHKLHEIIYQLDGNLQITGDLVSGTNVRFSFPIKKN